MSTYISLTNDLTWVWQAPMWKGSYSEKKKSINFQNGNGKMKWVLYQVSLNLSRYNWIVWQWKSTSIYYSQLQLDLLSILARSNLCVFPDTMSLLYISAWIIHFHWSGKPYITRGPACDLWHWEDKPRQLKVVISDSMYASGMWHCVTASVFTPPYICYISRLSICFC